MIARRMSSAVCLAAVFLLARGAGAEEAAKVELKAKKGDALEFTVKRESTTSGSGPQGDFSFNSTSTIQYKIEVGEKKDNGDLVLNVTYASVKAAQEGRGDPWEFDSAKKEGGDEAAAMLREAIAKPITVNVAGGKIREIAGFPEAARPQDGQGGGFRGFRALRIAGEGALRADLEHILASTVSGQALEKGKAYRLERERPAGDQGGQRQGRGRFGGGFGDGRIAYTFDGDEKAGDVPAVKFSLAADETQRPDDGNQGGRRFGGGPANVKGSALISLKDGLLLKLESKTERGGPDANFSMKSSLTITRGAPKRETVSL